MHRRTFVELAGSSALLTALNALSPFTNIPDSMNTNFELLILATNWGFNGSLDQYCSRVKEEGYNGIEIWWPTSKKDQDELFAVLEKYKLEVGFLCGGQEADFNTHLSSFTQMTNAAATNSYRKPLYINCHSGRDFFQYDQNSAFIDFTTELSKQTGILICHETHRSRILYSAPVAHRYLTDHPGLKITLDISHWCNVHESLLQDQPENVSLALERAEHLHARIGHPEGPQVNDPRAPEWKEIVETHFKWWDKVVERKKRKGERLTILTEFGPPDYMPVEPYTRKPLADQWAINVYMMQQLRKRYLP